ncbi:lipoprotein ABC transporter permease [Cryobacterium sp. PH31-AA6]|uniref:FtsX-like permease family protein n=1 Tax=Cryobacterium sp. PH31-AA6 TaxID=3046205 RepID=UPI0024BA5D65|nr:FtsX-like permease family protein [Cryobacterium sp. PH31-AA6]MDJ0325506.1 lipoprotein ABC transporter permease [Cryobacterium sp. PH31-AA6]
MSRIGAILREACASALSQPVASIVSITIVCGMCLTVLLTTGRTVGAEQAVISSIDSAGTRSIVVRADSDAGLTSDVLARLSRLDGIVWAGAFGAADDARNAKIPGGPKVPIRQFYGSELAPLGVSRVFPLTNHSSVASRIALSQLGMPNGVGGVQTVDTGTDYAIVGSLTVPDYLQFLEPLILVPQDPTADATAEPVSILVVVAKRPDLVAPVSRAVQSILAVDDPTKIEVSTSEQLATLRGLVESQLGLFGRDLVLVVFAVTGTLVAAIQYGLVMLRRKDFGRRRALGASQSLIVTLVLAQMVILSAAGTLVGSAAAAAALAIQGDPLPAPNYFAGIAILAIVASTIAAIVPSAAAARRDPLRELRVP